MTQSKAYWREEATRFFNDLPEATRGEFRDAGEFTDLVRVCCANYCLLASHSGRSTMK